MGKIWKERDRKYKVAFEFFMQIANPVLSFINSKKFITIKRVWQAN